jgi:hypothetical protein
MHQSRTSLLAGLLLEGFGYTVGGHLLQAKSENASNSKFSTLVLSRVEQRRHSCQPPERIHTHCERAFSKMPFATSFGTGDLWIS